MQGGACWGGWGLQSPALSAASGPRGPGGLGEALSVLLIPAGAPRDTGCFPGKSRGNGSDSDPAVRDTALPPTDSLFSEEMPLPPASDCKIFHL